MVKESKEVLDGKSSEEDKSSTTTTTHQPN